MLPDYLEKQSRFLIAGINYMQRFFIAWSSKQLVPAGARLKSPANSPSRLVPPSTPTSFLSFIVLNGFNSVKAIVIKNVYKAPVFPVTALKMVNIHNSLFLQIQHNDKVSRNVFLSDSGPPEGY